MKQHINLILRGFKQIAQFPRPILLSRTLSSIVQAGLPFINIWFSAQILNELAGNRDSDRLMFLVTLTLGLNLAATLAGHLLRRWEAYCDSQSFQLVWGIYTDKMLSMDYIDVENPDIQQQNSTLKQHHQGMGFGFGRLLNQYQGIVDGFIKMLLSIAFAFSLFTLRTPEGSPFAFLDSPLAILGVLLLLACSTLLAPYFNLVGGKIWAKASEDNNMANRFFGFYYELTMSSRGQEKDIRIYNQKKLIDHNIAQFGDVGQWLAYAQYHSKFIALSSVISFGANGLIFLFIAMKAFAGAFGVGSIVQYVGAITQFGNGLSAVMTGVGELVNNNPFLEKSFEFLDIPNEKYQGTLPIEKRDDNDYEIEFKNVSFKYPGSEKYALRNLSMKLHIGQRLAVVGMNGSGKTTMIKLLCRLYDPTEGEIMLNGIDIRKYNYDEYMAIFSVVFQDFELLPFTLGQNVAASVQYDEARVKETLAQAGFGDKLELDTYLYKNFEETGVEVSGGEAQKIALARALYKNSPFIVLDEPTAALDPIAEFEIYSAFNEIVGGKTAVYISHRLSSCRFCDDIAVFHEGELIQRGKHDDLVGEESGKYLELWNAQAQYYSA